MKKSKKSTIPKFKVGDYVICHCGSGSIGSRCGTEGVVISLHDEIVLSDGSSIDRKYARKITKLERALK